MKKTVAVVLGFMMLGPALAPAESYRHTTIIVEERYSHPAAGGVVERITRGKQSHRYQRVRHRTDGDVVYGRVVSVEPVYPVTTYGGSRDSCIRRIDDGRSYNSRTPTLLGAIIGGALGHRIGDRHGDPEVAAIAAGILGASIGRDVGRHLRESRSIVVDGPCGAHRSRQTRREPVEYVVRYRYNGRLYRTRMDYDPGEWIALDVDIEPV